MRAFPAARLKQALWRAGPAADSPAAAGVYEVVCGLLAWRAEVHHGGDRLLAEGLPDGGVPLLPLALVVRLVAGVEQQSPAEGAPAVLAAQQVPGRWADRRADALAALGPVSGQGGVIGRCPPGDQGVPDDLRPGEPAEVVAGFPAPEQPPVVPGRVEH